MKTFVWGLVLLLIVLHQDVWFWEDGTLLFGFLPIGIGYHVCISLAAAFTWWLATRYAWPKGLESPDAKSQGETADA